MPLGSPRALAAAFAAAAMCLAVAALADPFALVASVQGRVDVTVARGGETVRAAFGRPLERGDRVTVAEGGAATIYFSDGNVIELDEKSSVTVGGRVANRDRVGPGAGLPGPVFAQVSKVVAGGSRETGLVAIAPMRGGEETRPLILEPRNSNLFAARPAFAWRAVEGADRYRVTVSGDEGEAWRAETGATRLDWPEDADAPRPGTDYLWTLEALSDRGTVRREESAFHVLDDDDERAVRDDVEKIAAGAGGPDHAATHFLAGSYLAARGLYHLAAGHYERLEALAPDSPAPLESLGRVYRTIGLMDLAAESFQKALALSKTP